jgi:hypothetical protein
MACAQVGGCGGCQKPSSSSCGFGPSRPTTTRHRGWAAGQRLRHPDPQVRATAADQRDLFRAADVLGSVDGGIAAVHADPAAAGTDRLENAGGFAERRAEFGVGHRPRCVDHHRHGR